MTEEEIKKIAHEYGESKANCFDYDMYSNPDFRHKLKAKSEANKAMAVLQWLSRDYCIVPKSEIKETLKEFKEDARPVCEWNEKVISIEDIEITFESLFGKSLFEE